MIDGKEAEVSTVLELRLTLMFLLKSQKLFTLYLLILSKRRLTVPKFIRISAFCFFCFTYKWH